MPEEPSRPRGRGLVLIGYRGTGKTTVGRLLAARLGRAAADSDTELERRTGRPIAALFTEEGEPSFREHEAAVLAELTKGDATVLTTGGGAILRPTNRANLRMFGTVVWLTASPSSIRRRLAENLAGRPGLTAAGPLAEIEAVLATRTPLYAETADHIVATDDRTPDEVADAILALIRGEDAVS